MSAPPRSRRGAPRSTPCCTASTSSRASAIFRRRSSTRYARAISPGSPRPRRSQKEEASELVALHDEIEGLLIDTEREHIFGQLERGELIDEARRHIERELDLREATLLRNIPGAANHEG